jgi:tetratricopeptide (TPR) repeat protein
MTAVHHRIRRCPAWLPGLAFGLGLFLCFTNPFMAVASETSGGETHPAGHSAMEPAEANPAAEVIDPPAPASLNVALRNSKELIATSNLLSAPEVTAADKREEFQYKLDQGTKLKKEKDYPGAERAFVAVLESGAPEDLKRTALLELALLAQENQQLARAQQVFSQYISTYPDDPSVPEVLLRQGLLYRQMGATRLALTKFYAVMTTSLRLKLDKLDYYQRMVLQAQTEIADTYYLQGQYAEASDFLSRLLKLDSPQLNKAQVQYKLVRSLSSEGRNAEVVAHGESFIGLYPGSSDLAEIRFLLADSLKKLGRNREAMQQVLTLLETQQVAATNNPANWAYWQERTGNEIGNQLYKEGDYLNALEIYRNLSEINTNALWQIPVWYQTGLVYERLLQPEKAVETYGNILRREPEIAATDRTPSLDTVLDMARWRKDHLQWQLKAEKTTEQIRAWEPPKELTLSRK